MEPADATEGAANPKAKVEAEKNSRRSKAYPHFSLASGASILGTNRHPLWAAAESTSGNASIPTFHHSDTRNS